jgi:hypothetical protein
VKVRHEYPRQVEEIEHLTIPMSDGAQLAARMWLPVDADTSPVPAILEYIPYRKRDLTADHELSSPAGSHVRPREEGQVRARMSLAVGEEEVIGIRHILVDGLLDQSQTENAHVEVHVLLRIPRDRRYVM